jgi:membrane protein implicated in regulation of membrane protease activity
MGESGLSAWQLFLVVGLLLSAFEMFTPTFFALPAGIAFVMTAAVALFLDDWVALLVTLSVNLTLVYFAFYRFVWPRLERSAPKMNADALSGKVATVTEAVDPSGERGEVKLYGDRFRVVSSQCFSEGTRVMISGTQGNKVVIRALEEGEGEQQ